MEFSSGETSNKRNTRQNSKSEGKIMEFSCGETSKKRKTQQTSKKDREGVETNIERKTKYVSQESSYKWCCEKKVHSTMEGRQVERSTNTKSPKLPKKKLLNWGQISQKLAQCSTFSEMEEVVLQFEGPPLPPIKEKEHTVLSTRSTIDKIALGLQKENQNTCNLYPVQTYGDGNCFLRSLSILIYGNQYHFQELRGRITYEGIIHKNYYLNNEYLSFGAVKTYNIDLATVIAQYSGKYISKDCLTADVYKEEMLDVAKNASYCGLWQYFQASNVLDRPIASIYPIDGCVRVDLDRMVYPWTWTNGPVEICPKAYCIMWTTLDNRSKVANHFVPLLRMGIPEIPVEIVDVWHPLKE